MRWDPFLVAEPQTLLLPPLPLLKHSMPCHLCLEAHDGDLCSFPKVSVYKLSLVITLSEDQYCQD